MSARGLIAAGACALSFLLGWAVYENTALLDVSHYEADFREMPRIVQLSDLHKRRFGRHQERLIRKVRECQPELIVITGDLITRSVHDYAETERLLTALSGIAPVIVSEGNHEVDLPPDDYVRFRKTVHRSGARFLDNRIIRFGGIHIAGLSLPRAYYRGGGLFGFRGKYQCSVRTMETLLGKCPDHTLLLAHNPLFFPAYAQWGAKLTLSGHVHGGAVRLPLLGGLLSPERRFFPKYSKGRYQNGRAEMIVSAGLGKLRFNDPPEIAVISAKES
jgi:hypothetical protein